MDNKTEFEIERPWHVHSKTDNFTQEHEQKRVVYQCFYIAQLIILETTLVWSI